MLLSFFRKRISDLEPNGEGVGGDVGDDQVGGDEQGHPPGHRLRRDPEAAKGLRAF